MSSFIHVKARGVARLSSEIDAAEQALRQDEGRAKAEVMLLQEQARRKDQEANKTAAAMMASQIADDMDAVRYRKETKEAEAQKVLEQVQRKYSN
jgi:molecular chaperone GrpE (heat shock protein)